MIARSVVDWLWRVGLLPGALLLAGLSGVAPARAGDYDVVRQLVEADQFDQARSAAAGFSADPERRTLNVAFTDALILKRQGRLPEAAAKMRAILGDHPGFARVRQELAQTLLVMGDLDASRYQFELLSQASPDAAQRSFYDRYISGIKTLRPWSLDAYVAIAPSSNINSGVSAKTVFIGGVPFNPSNGKKSGVGLAYGLAGAYRFDLDPRWEWTIGGNASGLAYRDKTYDITRGDAFSEIAFHQSVWRVGLAATVDRQLAAWEGYGWEIGPQLSLQRSFGPAGLLTAIASFKEKKFDDIEAYDGHGISGSVFYRYQLAEKTALTPGMLVEKDTARKDFNAYQRYKPSLQITQALPFGVLADFTASVEKRNYDADFPLTSGARRDRIEDFTLGATLSRFVFQGLAPRIEVSYRIAHSNIDLFSYKSKGCSLYLTHQF